MKKISRSGNPDGIFLPSRSMFGNQSLRMKSWHSNDTEIPANILACSVFVRSVKTKFEYHQDCTVSAILREHLWWVCACRLKCASGADNSLTSFGVLCRVSSFTFDTCSILLFPDAFSKKALIPTCSPRSEFAVTLVSSRPEDEFIDLIAKSFPYHSFC